MKKLYQYNSENLQYEEVPAEKAMLTTTCYAFVAIAFIIGMAGGLAISESKHHSTAGVHTMTAQAGTHAVLISDQDLQEAIHQVEDSVQVMVDQIQESLRLVQERTDTIIHTIIKTRIQHQAVALAVIWGEVGHEYENLAEPNNYYNMRRATKRITTRNGTGKDFAGYDRWQESVYDYAMWQYQNGWNLTREQYYVRLETIFCKDPGYVAKIRRMVPKACAKIKEYKELNIDKL